MESSRLSFDVALGAHGLSSLARSLPAIATAASLIARLLRSPLLLSLALLHQSNPSPASPAHLSLALDCHCLQLLRVSTATRLTAAPLDCYCASSPACPRAHLALLLPALTLTLAYAHLAKPCPLLRTCQAVRASAHSPAHLPKPCAVPLLSFAQFCPFLPSRPPAVLPRPSRPALLGSSRALLRLVVPSCSSRALLHSFHFVLEHGAWTVIREHGQ